MIETLFVGRLHLVAQAVRRQILPAGQAKARFGRVTVRALIAATKLLPSLRSDVGRRRRRPVGALNQQLAPPGPSASAGLTLGLPRDSTNSLTKADLEGCNDLHLG